MSAILLVVDERFETINTTKGAECGLSMLHTKQGFHVVNIKDLKVAEFSLLDDTISLEEAVLRILAFCLIKNLRKHGVAKVGE